MKTKKQPDWEKEAVHSIPLITKLTQEDVWGKWQEAPMKRLTKGMIVAQGYGMDDAEYERRKVADELLSNICPIWGDKLPYKSVTAIFRLERQREVEKWLDYVHGGGIERYKEVGNGFIAIRSNYMCW